MKDLRQRLRNALARLYPGVGFDLNWIKESDHQWHDGGDDLIDRWHVVIRRKQEQERRRYLRQPRPQAPHPIPAAGDDIPF